MQSASVLLKVAELELIVSVLGLAVLEPSSDKGGLCLELPLGQLSVDGPRDVRIVHACFYHWFLFSINN